jgi:phosphatidylglycerophosphate synthase
MANALTAIRLLLVLPIAAALAHPDLLAPGIVALVLCVAIATDYLDGPIARRTATA